MNDSTLHMTLWSKTLKLNLDRQLSMPFFCSCGASFVCSAFTVPAGVLKALSKTTEARPAVGQGRGCDPFQMSGFSLAPHVFICISKMHLLNYIIQKYSKMFTMTMTSNQEPWVKSEKSAWGTNLGIMPLYQCRNNRTGPKEQRTTPNEEQNPWCSKQWKTHPKGREIMKKFVILRDIGALPNKQNETIFFPLCFVTTGIYILAWSIILQIFNPLICSHWPVTWW